MEEKLSEDALSSQFGESEETAFIAEQWRIVERSGGGGHFTPAARLVVTPYLRTSGLLRALPDAEARSLLLLLTFLRPDARCEATVPEVATALAIPEAKARARMEALSRFRWQGKRIVRTYSRGSGLESYLPAASILFVTDTESMNELNTATNLVEGNAVDMWNVTDRAAARASARRNLVIAHSRATYGRSRADVEAQIAEQLARGSARKAAEASDGPEAAARLAMTSVGVSRRDIDALIRSFPLERINDQIEWLPHRHPRDPAKLLVASIRGGYEPPAFVRLRRMVEAETVEADEREKAAEGSALLGDEGRQQ